MSIPLEVNSKTKLVSVDEDYLEDLNEDKQAELLSHIDRLNEMHKNVVGLNGGVPPRANFITKNVTDQVKKFIQNAESARKAGKKEEALKHLSLAVEMALKRAPWESVQYVIGELSAVLGLRADVYMSLSMWPEAFTDSSLLTMINPGDPKSHYRKGKCLQTINKWAEAAQCYSTACTLDGNKTAMYRTALEEVKDIMGKN